MAISLRKPGPTQHGERVAIVAPGSHPPLQELKAGMQRLEKAGLIPENRVGADQYGYLSGRDADRVNALNRALTSPDLKTIFCARGGFGTTRILDRVDFAALAASPKLIVGYSDITALQLGALSVAAVPSLSAAMVAVDWPAIAEPEAGLILSILNGTADTGIYGESGIAMKPARAGAVTGPLVGGNLTMVCRLIGTPYLPDLSECILFLEEVGEAPYRIDGLFSQLHLSGILEKIGGLVLGAFTDAAAKPGQASLELDDVLAHWVDVAGVPAASGLPYGHISPKQPIPIGVEAELVVHQGDASLRATEQLTIRL
ncbi:MAG: LD-carboxypeptidase [Rhodothermia bacterium]|nr:LD-carboxypeptidase [Rhodothermia bacterium]